MDDEKTIKKIDLGINIKMDAFIKYLQDSTLIIEENYNNDLFEENTDLIEELLAISSKINRKIKIIKTKSKRYQPITCNICNTPKKKNNYYNGGSHGDKTCYDCKKLCRKNRLINKIKEKRNLPKLKIKVQEEEDHQENIKSHQERIKKDEEEKKKKADELLEEFYASDSSDDSDISD